MKDEDMQQPAAPSAPRGGTLARPQIIRFPPFELDLGASLLRRDGGIAIALRPKNWEVLRYLVERPGILVSKDELLDRVWGDVSVSEGILSVSVRELRRALGDDLRKPRLIETVHRRGYRFIAAVEHASERHATAALTNSSPASGAPCSPFVSRQTELDCLEESLAKGLRGERHIVFVSGAAGIGKSALVHAFRERLQQRRQQQHEDAPITVVGQCVPQYRSEDVCFPILDAVAELCRSPIGVQVIEILQRTAPEWLIRLGDVITPAQREALQATLRPQAARWMLRDLVVAVEQIAANHSIVLVIEDLHWSDLGTLDFIAHLAERTDAAKLLVICTRRGDEASPHPAELLQTTAELAAHGRIQTIELDALSLDDTCRYLTQTLGEGTALPALGRWLHERSDGNPLFMVSLTEELLRQGMIQTTSGGWQLHGDTPDLPGIPHTLDSILKARLAPLDAADRRVLEAATLQGLDFWDACVTSALAGDETTAAERLQTLASTGPVIRWTADERWPDGTCVGRYRFTHALYRQVLADSMPLHRKSEWHRRIAERLECAFASCPESAAAALAGHFEDAGDRTKASSYHAVLGIDATRRYAFAEALGHLDRALDRIDPQKHPDSYRLWLLQAKATCLVCTEGTTAAVYDCWQEVLKLTERMGDSFSISWAWVGHMGYHCFRGEHRQALEFATKIRDLGLREASPLILVWGEFGLTAEHVMTGNLNEAASAFARGMSAYASPGDWRPHHKPSPEARSVGLMAISLAYAVAGKEKDALASIREALQTTASTGRHFIGQPLALTFWSVLHALLQQAPQAYAKAHETLAEAERLGHSGLCGVAGIVEGWALITMGKPGLKQINRGHELLGSASGAAQSLCLLLLADAFATLGRVAQALDYARDGLALAQRSGEHLALPELHRLHAELALRAAEDKERTAVERAAETELRGAIKFAQHHDMPLWELRAALSLARLLSRRGDACSARKTVEHSLARFAGDEATAERTAATELLTQLRSARRRPHEPTIASSAS